VPIGAGASGRRGFSPDCSPDILRHRRHSLSEQQAVPPIRTLADVAFALGGKDGRDEATREAHARR